MREPGARPYTRRGWSGSLSRTCRCIDKPECLGKPPRSALVADPRPPAAASRMLPETPARPVRLLARERAVTRPGSLWSMNSTPGDNRGTAFTGAGYDRTPMLTSHGRRLIENPMIPVLAFLPKLDELDSSGSGHARAALEHFRGLDSAASQSLGIAGYPACVIAEFLPLRQPLSHFCLAARCPACRLHARADQPSGSNRQRT
jgi:hypothetical protein